MGSRGEFLGRGRWSISGDWQHTAVRNDGKTPAGGWDYASIIIGFRTHVVFG